MSRQLLACFTLLFAASASASAQASKKPAATKSDPTRAAQDYLQRTLFAFDQCQMTTQIGILKGHLAMMQGDLTSRATYAGLDSAKACLETVRGAMGGFAPIRDGLSGDARSAMKEYYAFLQTVYIELLPTGEETTRDHGADAYKTRLQGRFADLTLRANRVRAEF